MDSADTKAARDVIAALLKIRRFAPREDTAKDKVSILLLTAAHLILVARTDPLADAAARSHIVDAAAFLLLAIEQVDSAIDCHAVFPANEQRFAIGDRVAKAGGDYQFEGTVQMVGQKRSGAWRYVVENDLGVLHIFSAKNLERRDG